MMAHRPVPSGYASRAYAESLSGFGEILHLPRCGGYLLKRKIPGTTEHDAMGCYPLFFCGNWTLLEADLAELPEELVSVALVADPFGDYSTELLESAFDVVNPYRVHYIVDLEQPIGEIGSRHHRREARKALEKVRVEVCRNPVGFSKDWIKLYQALAKRHGIRGIRAFSARAFEQQLGMPGIVVHHAYCGERLVGAQLFHIQGDVVCCHLGAVSELGYETGAFYAMDRFSFELFSGRARKLDLGGGTGLSSAGDDGLSRYKKGWSTQMRPVYFCGRIINPGRYEALSQPFGPTNYFPVYRKGEFD